MLHPVRVPPASGSLPPWMCPRKYLGSITTKSQVPYGGSSRASSQAWLVGTRITPTHATRPIRSLQAPPPGRAAPLHRLLIRRHRPADSAPHHTAWTHRAAGRYRSLWLPVSRPTARPSARLILPFYSKQLAHFKTFTPPETGGFPDFDGVELAMQLHSISLIEHACED